jgi:hypothetical protein
MSAKDTFHDDFKAALIKDGWTITHDPFTLSFGSRNVYADLGAERSIAATRGAEKIAVEIKCFIGDSEVRQLEIALGQFVLYRLLLERLDPNRVLLLAMPETAFKSLFEDAAGQGLIRDVELKIIVFDAAKQEIVQWLK